MPDYCERRLAIGPRLIRSTGSRSGEQVHAVRAGGLGQQSGAAAERHATAPAVARSRQRKSGRCSRPTRRRRRVSARSACTPSRRAATGAHERRPPPPSSSRCSAASSSIASGSIRQRASARRRSTPSPLHGASSSTRSNAPASQRQRGGRRPRRARTDGSPSRRAAPCDQSQSPGMASTATTRPSSPMASAIAVALPPGAAPTSSDPVPRARVEQPRPPPGSPWSCGVARPSRDRRHRRGRPCPARRARPPPAQPRVDVDGHRSHLGFEGVGGDDAPRVDPQVSAGGSFIAAKAAAASSAPRSAVSRSRPASRGTTSAPRPIVGPRPGWPERGRPARNTAFAKPLARGDAPRARRPSRPPRRARAPRPQLVRAEPQCGSHRRVELRRGRGRCRARAGRRGDVATRSVP